MISKSTNAEKPKSEFSGFRFRDTIYMSEVSGGCLVYDGGVSEYHGFYLNSHAGSGGTPGSHKVRRRLWYRPPCGTAAPEPPLAHPEACRRMPPPTVLTGGVDLRQCLTLPNPP